MKPEFKYGLIGGACVCAWIGLSHRLGFHSTASTVGTYAGFLSNLIPLATLFLLLRAKRARIYDGRLSLAAGIGAGALTSLVLSLVVYIFLATYSQFINPTWIDQALELKVAQLRAQHVTEAVIQERILEHRDASSPTGLLYTVVVNLTLLGSLCSLGLTLLVRLLPHRETRL